jgi:hypothetical protein
LIALHSAGNFRRHLKLRSHAGEKYLARALFLPRIHVEIVFTRGVLYALRSEVEDTMRSLATMTSRTATARPSNRPAARHFACALGSKMRLPEQGRLGKPD